MTERITDERRELLPSVWTNDITEALSFEFKAEVDQYLAYLEEVVGYRAEAILTFGVEKTQ